MIINHNIAALNTYRQLSSNNAIGQKSLEKLSSGLRINRAGDDAAGLAISEKMRGQIRGLEQASRNAQDGISMIQTAEGALNEVHSILQRMRELATQAANDTNVDVDRNEIQKEINQLTSEINRIGNTTEFNTQKVLKGSEEVQELSPAFNLDATGYITEGTLSGGKTNEAENAELKITFTDASGTMNGKTITFNFGGEEFTLNLSASDLSGNGENLGSITANSATINLDTNSSGTTTAAEYADLVKQALEGMIAANNNVSSTDFEVSADSGTVTIKALDGGNFAAGAGSIMAQASSGAVWSDSGTILKDYGKYVTYDYASTQIDFSGINSAGIEALVGKGMTINGQTIEFYNADNGIYEGQADFAVNLSSLIANSGVSGGDLVSAIENQIGDKLDGVTLSAGAGGKLVITANEGGEAGNSISFSDGVDRDAVTSAGAFTATFQVGANNGQSMQIDINDMRSLALGIAGNDPLSQITDSEGNVIENARFTQVTTVTNGTDNETVEYALDVSTHESAAAAVQVINNAIETVSAERSKLGAYQNRLEHTINNLGTSSENLAAAESRIRDVDMAEEMMEYTKMNILSQAAQAMLAQANQLPQGVLQLLR